MIKVRHMAQVCREAIAALLEHEFKIAPPPTWETLNDRQRRMSLFVVNFILATPDAIPEACHNAWMGEMIHNEGYRRGEFRDDVAKTHPDLVPFQELPNLVRSCYAISIGVVRGMTDIGNRYINCAPQTTVEATVDAVAPSVAEPVVAEPFVSAADAGVPTMTSNGIDQAVDQVIESVRPTTQEDQGFVHFAGHNQLAESGDIAAGTDPASAE